MKIYPVEICNGQKLIKGYQSFRVIEKIKETPKTITFLMKHYKSDIRWVGEFNLQRITNYNHQHL